MGGIGSGRRYRWDTKDTTESYHTIDVRRWHREKLLNPNQSFACQWACNEKITSSIRVNVETEHITLSYRHKISNNDWVDLSYPVFIVWTSCNYGNKRPWFLCPTKNCRRRVAILYSGKIFACRHCYELAYPCQRETLPFRASRQADKIREKLGWEEGCLNGCGLKPKGMHKKTFKRLSAQHNAYVAQGVAWFGSRFSMMGESIDDWL